MPADLDNSQEATPERRPTSIEVALMAENERLRAAVNAALCTASEWWVTCEEALRD